LASLSRRTVTGQRRKRDVHSHESRPAGRAVRPLRRLQDLPADPSAEIPWNGVDPGVWERRCVCYVERIHVDPRGGLVRLDPYDPSTFHHLGGASDGTRPIPRSLGPS
jgi:hypothetical protein